MTSREDAPFIQQVIGESGNTYNGGVTEDIHFTLVGVASSNAQLDIYDMQQVIDFVQADESGVFNRPLGIILPPGNHELTVHTKGSELISNFWRFHIMARPLGPSISNVQDSAGRPIANDGATEDTIVTLFGHAKEPMVEVLDGTKSWGIAQVSGDESWNKRLAGLEVERHEFTAKHLVNEHVSLPWSFTVLSSARPPEILRVRDSLGNDIANGGTTDDTQISLSGTAKENSTVEVLDEDTSWGTTQAALSGSWVKTLAGLDVGLHLFMAKEVASQLESNRWELTVQAEEPLVIDTTPMHLDGFTIWMSGGVRTGNESPGNTQIRQPTGGVGPYTYSTSSISTAEVESNGLVRGRGWGEAIISVTDQKSNVVTFTVIVTNVWMPSHSPYAHTHSESLAVLEASGPRYEAFDQRAYDELVRVYQRPFPYEENYWCPVLSGCGSGLALLFRYPEQVLGCADPNLEYQVFMIRKKGTLPGDPETSHGEDE